MPRISNKDVLADRQDAGQPALFDDSQMPVMPAVLESIKARRYEHSGQRLLEDDQTALRLVELISLKWGVKKISREMNISPHTVRAARRTLVVQGKLAPYKQRVVEMMEEGIEAGIQVWRDAVEEGRLSAAQIPVGLGIIFDKRALMMGEPTSIRGEGVAAPEGLKVEDLNRYLEALPSCKTVETGAPADSASTVLVTADKDLAGLGASDATLDDSRWPRGAGFGVEPGPAGGLPEPERPADRCAEGGGGGPDRPAVD